MNLWKGITACVTRRSAATLLRIFRLFRGLAELGESSVSHLAADLRRSPLKASIVLQRVQFSIPQGQIVWPVVSCYTYAKDLPPDVIWQDAVL